MSLEPIYPQSGVIPYRYREGNLEVLLITSRKSRRWIIPKGLIEPDLTSPDSAAKEAWEEAGVIGKLLPGAMGNYEYRKWGGICQVEVFGLQVTQVLADWQESRERKRQWFSVKEAIKRLEPEKLKNMLKKLPERLNKANN